MSLYEMLENLIINKRYSKEDILDRVNTFYAYNQINKEEYEKLMKLIKDTYAETL